MGGVEEIIDKWRRSNDDARLEDVRKVINEKIAPRAKVIFKKRGTSHVISISHQCLKGESTFKGRPNFNVVCSDGRKVTKFYYQDILVAIAALDKFEEK